MSTKFFAFCSNIQLFFFCVFFFLKHRHVAGVCNWNYTFLSMVDIVGAHGFGLFTYLYSTDRETASLVLLTSI
jgi:hypothetical protein